MSADDLEDDFVIETIPVGTEDVSDHENVEGPTSHATFDDAETADTDSDKGVSRKRAGKNHASADDLEDDFIDEDVTERNKKRKKNKSKSDAPQEAPKSKKMRCINLNDYEIYDPSSIKFNNERKTETLMDFLKLLYPDKSKRMLSDCKRNPFHLLIVCQSAERVIEVMNVLKKALPNIKMAKLFSRHIKLQEHVEMISSGKFVMGVGTPNRILKLIQDTNASDWNLLQNVVLDTSFKDQKNFSLLDLFVCKDDLESLLKDLSERPCKLWSF